MFINCISQASSLFLIFRIVCYFENMGTNNSSFNELSSNDSLKKLITRAYQPYRPLLESTALLLLPYTNQQVNSQYKLMISRSQQVNSQTER